jgi:phage tail-like protein
MHFRAVIASDAVAGFGSPAVASRDVPSRESGLLLRISCFEILIGDREIGFAEVGRLTSETDVAASPDRPQHRLAPVVLRRALTTSTELYEWRRLIVAGKDDRRDVTIRQLSAPGGTIVNEWRLLRAWPCRWSGPAFNAMSNDIAFEELELIFDDFVWLEHKQRITEG